MHETTERLYVAARLLKKIEGQSAVARALNVSPQVVKNWESRGVSSQGMIDAQRLIGCRSTWVETGEGDMAEIHGGLTSPSPDTPNESLPKPPSAASPLSISPAAQRLIDRITELDRSQKSPPALYALIENALDLVQPIAGGSDYAGLDDFR